MSLSPGTNIPPNFMPACLRISSKYRERYWQHVTLPTAQCQLWVFTLSLFWIPLCHRQDRHPVSLACDSWVQPGSGFLSPLFSCTSYNKLSPSCPPLILLHLYCYYKKQTLSIPFGHLKQRFWIFDYFSRPDKNQKLFRVPLWSYMWYDG